MAVTPQASSSQQGAHHHLGEAAVAAQLADVPCYMPPDAVLEGLQLVFVHLRAAVGR
jgi:hypothetical protein